MPTVTIINPTISVESDMKLRTAAYCRVSSSSEDQLNSYNAQLTYYSNKFNDSETEELVELYADSGITGTCDNKRPEFIRMINDCRRGKIDRIYTKSISRFARNTRDCLKYIRELRSLGITIMFEKENIDTAKITDEIMITIMGGLAQEESVSISQNMQWSIERRMKNGTFVASNQPYGYDKIDGQLVINEAEAEIVRRIFSEYLCGSGLNAICQSLNADGLIMGKSGIEWKKKAVRYILTNEKYIGDCLWRKKYTENVFPFKKTQNRGQADQYYISDHHEPIIQPDIFAQVQELIKQRGEEFGNTEFHTYPLSLKIQCGNCGKTYRRREINSRIYWVCRQHDFDSRRCPCKEISEEKLYDAFIRSYNKLLLNYKEILIPLQTSLHKLKLKKFTGHIRIIDIHKEIAQLREQSHVLANLLTKGFISEEKYHEQNSELTQKIKRKQKDLKMLTKSGDDDLLEQITILIEWFEGHDKMLIGFDEKAFEFMVDKIIVIKQEKFEIHMIGGLKFTEQIADEK